MPGRYSSTVHKLQIGLGKKGIVTLINQNQFWSECQQRQVTMFVVYETEYDEVNHKRIQKEVLRTALQADVVVYLSNRYKGLTKEESMKGVEEQTRAKEDFYAIHGKPSGKKKTMLQIQNIIVNRNKEKCLKSQGETKT